ncbi:hypothetical protein IWX47DRAFT_886696 [Phyllosticta citricarpa]
MSMVAIVCVFRTGSGISDSSSGSISTSPRSTASSLYSHGTFSPNIYQQPPLSQFTNPSTSQLGFHSTSYSQSPFGMPSIPQGRRMSSITDHSQSGMLPPTRSPGMGNPVSPSMSATARENYTTSTPHLNRHITSPRHSESGPSRGSYTSMPETPRSVLHPGGALPLTSPSSIAYSSTGANMLPYQPHHEARPQTESPPFSAQETFHDIISDGQSITPQLDCKIEKGFFYSSDQTWTCYRRNYFAVQCSYTLNPHISNARLYLNRGSRQEQIQALAVTLSAAVDGPTGKPIELVQHTPKRDKGPQNPIKMEKINPVPPGKTQSDPHGYSLNFSHTASSIAPPYLPLQQDGEQPYSPAGHSTSNYQHLFERIQFKSATANNGKRRAQQQYYHLIVELYADVRRTADEAPDWVRVAQRVSAAVVVRGRSPSHYQNEGPNSAGASRGGGTGSGAGGPGHGAYGSAGGPARGSLGGAGMGLLGSSGLSGQVYGRSNQYSLDPSPIGNHSVSSASSVSGGPIEGLVSEGNLMDDEDRKQIDSYQGYQYYPGPMAEAGLPLGVKSDYDSKARVKMEYSDNGMPSSIAGGCRTFQGFGSSRGLYPDMSATGY